MLASQRLLQVKHCRWPFVNIATLHIFPIMVVIARLIVVVSSFHLSLSPEMILSGNCTDVESSSRDGLGYRMGESQQNCCYGDGH